VFYPDDVPFLTLRWPECNVRAKMCAECGHIELTGDTEKLGKLLEGVDSNE